MKSALHQQLFPAHGLTVPRIRFKEFTDSWQSVRLGDVVQITGGFAFQSSDYDDDGTFRVVTIANVSGARYIEDLGNNLDIDDPKVIARLSLDKDELLVSLTGNVGRVSRATGNNEVLNQRVAKLTPLSASRDFIEAIVANPKFEMAMIVAGQGAAQKNIGNQDVLDYMIQLPTDSEQSYVGRTIDLIGDYMAIYQFKVAQLTRLKNTLLGQMFI